MLRPDRPRNPRALAGRSALSDDDEFAHIVRLAPLVSIDLIIRAAKQNVLVALRTNEPARGVYFVPGGRIRKDETKRAWTAAMFWS